MQASAPSISGSFRETARGVARRVARALIRGAMAPLLHHLGVTAALRALRRRLRARGRLLILVYHRVCEPGDDAFPLLSETLAVTPARFDAQMAYLARNYTVLSLPDALRRLDEGTLPRGDALVITFDDGYRDNLTNALPSLRRRRLPATVFLATDHIGTGVPTWFDRLSLILAALDPAALRRDSGAVVPAEIYALILAYLGAARQPRKALVNALCDRVKTLPEDRRQALLAALAAACGADRRTVPSDPLLMLDWAEARRMTDEGITFGSHSCSHPILSRLPPGDVEREVAESKRLIEANLGQPCRVFAYPNGLSGDWPADAAGILVKHGYAAACANMPGLNAPATDRMALRRLPVANHRLDLFGLVLERWLLLGRVAS